MATTTTNYGFDVPTSSDLVKNGATQIALLGQDLDTFLFRPFTRNAVLNSAMNVWQRGTSISLAASSGTTFLADRWCVQTGANQACTVSRQATGDTTNLPFIQYAMRFQRNSGQTGTGAIGIMQPMETINTIPYAGKTVTLSFYARKGADYSAASSALLAYLRTGTGTDQNPYSGYTGDNTSFNTTATLTTTWQRFSVTATLGSTVTEMTVQFGFTPTGTASTNDYYEVTGVQVEVGNQNSPFAPATPTYATELAACQRYYYRYTAVQANTNFGVGMNQSTTAGNHYIKFPITLRTQPTSVDFSTLNISDYASYGAAITTLAIVGNASGVDTVNVVSGGATGMTSQAPSFLRGTTAGTSYIAFSAELQK